MSHHPRAVTAALCTVLAALAAPVLALAEAPRVVVRLYDVAGAAGAVRAAAMAEAAAILRDAGITVAWRDCSRGGAAYPCDTVRGQGELSIRVVPRFVPGGPLPAGSVSARAAADGEELSLGFAAVDAQTRTGVVATIFHDRVVTVAQRARVDTGVLLGRAIAHELGHLLLQVAGHGRAGLMRATWTDDELTADVTDDWRFAAAEQQRLRQVVR